MTNARIDGWKVKTLRNSKNQEVLHGSQAEGCRVLEQEITCPDGSTIRIEQHISNTSDYHSIDIFRVQGV